jgi:predicted HNH restriction endonuclease
MKKLPRRKCKNCGKECNRPEKFYCNNLCQFKYQRQSKVNDWLNGIDAGIATNGQIRPFIRKHLIYQVGECCERCGWNQRHAITGKCPLEIHHKDGNHENNKPNNLEVICPNCHSLTDTYKNMNKGSGRKCRRS